MCLLKVLCQTCSTYILLSSSLNFCICKQRRRRLIKIKSTLLKERELHLCTSLSQTTGLKIFFVTLAQKGMRLNHLAKNCTEPATVQGRPGQVDRGSKPSGTQF